MVARARQQAVVIVDEVGVAVVDPLVIRHVGVGGVDADALGDDLGQRPAGADQIVVDVAGALLVAHQAAVLQLVVEAADLRGCVAVRRRWYPFWFLRLVVDCRDPTLDMQAATTIVPDSRGRIGMNKTQSGTEWTVSIVAGTGEPGYSGDGSSALRRPPEQSVRSGVCP